jgi:phosphoglycerol transferase MdoB-like AlkP superfamily enzyme
LNRILDIIKKNPLKNGFFLMSAISFGLALLSQWLGRTLLIHIQSNPEIPPSIKPNLQSAGLLQDISISSYYSIIICILLLLPKRAQLIAIFQGVFLFLQSIVILIDYYLLKSWSTKINRLALDYIAYPQEIVNSVGTHERIYIVLFLVALVLFCLGLGKLILSICNSSTLNFSSKWILFPLVLIFIVGARGGIASVPLSLGSAQKTNNGLYNALSTNSLWNLFHAYQQPTLDQNIQAALMPNAMEKSALDKYMGPDTFPGGLKRMPQIIRKGSNIIIVVLEGIGEHWLERDPSESITPNLLHLAQDGMWFKKAYAAGDRTDKGLAAIFCGYPSQPVKGILMDPSKWGALHQQFLPSEFQKQGYNTNFYYGGDLDFANMGTFLKFVGFQKVNTYPNSVNSKWGVNDLAMSNLVLNDIKQLPQPFFASWLMISSHEPYDVVENQDLSETEKLKLSIRYSDAALGKLVDGLKRSNLYDSTVIVVVSDHSKSVGLPVTEDYEQEFFRIPLMISGGPIRDMYRGVAPHLIVSQTDLYATLTEQMLGKTDKMPFSRNMIYANHPGMAISFTDNKAVLAASGYRHYLFMDAFGLKTPSDSLVLGLQSQLIRNYFKK